MAASNGVVRACFCRWDADVDAVVLALLAVLSGLLLLLVALR